MTRSLGSFEPIRSVVAPMLLAGCLAALAALAGCGGPKGFYPNAKALAERDASEASEATAPPASDTSQVAAALQSQTTYLKLVEQMQRDAQWFASLAHLDALERRWPASPQTIRLRADALRHTEQNAESRRQYELLLATPLQAAGYRGLGLLAGAQADYAQAVLMLESARQHDPTDGLLLSDLGYAYVRAGRVADARVPLMQAMQLLPGQPQVQANLALYLAASRQVEQSEALMAAHRLSPATRAAVREAARKTIDGSAATAASASATTTGVGTVVAASTGTPSSAATKETP